MGLYNRRLWVPYYIAERHSVLCKNLPLLNWPVHLGGLKGTFNPALQDHNNRK